MTPWVHNVGAVDALFSGCRTAVTGIWWPFIPVSAAA